MALKPLIKKNLIQVKRNLIKTLFQLFYPCLIIIIVILVSKINPAEEIPEQTYIQFESNLTLKDNTYNNTFSY